MKMVKKKCCQLSSEDLSFQLGGKSPSLNRISIVSKPAEEAAAAAAGDSLAAPTVTQRVRKLSGNLFANAKKDSRQGRQQLFRSLFRTHICRVSPEPGSLRLHIFTSMKNPNEYKM